MDTRVRHYPFDSVSGAPYPDLLAIGPASKTGENSVMNASASPAPAGPALHGPAVPVTPAALPVPPIEVTFPDLERWASGNTGIHYVWSFAATNAGPHVLVQALTHGNEVCGAIALDWLLGEGFRPTRGM